VGCGGGDAVEGVEGDLLGRGGGGRGRGGFWLEGHEREDEGISGGERKEQGENGGISGACVGGES